MKITVRENIPLITLAWGKSASIDTFSGEYAEE